MEPNGRHWNGNRKRNSQKVESLVRLEWSGRRQLRANKESGDEMSFIQDLVGC